MATQPWKTLARLLDTLPADERHEIIALLLDRPGVAPPGAGAPGAGAPGAGTPSQLLAHVPEVAQFPGLRSGIASMLTGREEHQLVTIRMPSELHAQLRTWCTDHSFTMAAVIRGLVERFLEGQARQHPPAAPTP